MSGKVRRVDFSPDEYISGVAGVLRADEQGIYWMVCSLIMSEAGPIERNDRRLATLCMVRPADAKRIVDRLIEIGKLQMVGSKLGQKRAQNEVELASKRIQIASENGSKGGRPPKITEQNQQPEKPDGLSAAKLSPTINHQPPSSTEETSLRSVAPAASKPTAKSELMIVLDAEHAQDVIDHRNKIKKPMTPKAAKMLATKLGSFDEPNKAADFMIEKGWQSIEREWVVNALAQQRQPQTKPHGADGFGDLAEFYRAQAIREGEDSGSTDGAVQDVPKLAHYRA